MKPKSVYLQRYRATRPGPVPHGSDDGYVNFGCRCDECREAHAERRRLDREASLPDDASHDTQRHPPVTQTGPESVTPQ